MWLLTHHFTDPARKVGQVTEIQKLFAFGNLYACVNDEDG